MLLTEKTWTVQLTEPEVIRVCDALHLAYKENKKHLPRSVVLDNDLEEIRILRNFFGDMIGCRFMGEDA